MSDDRIFNIFIRICYPVDGFIRMAAESSRSHTAPMELTTFSTSSTLADSSPRASASRARPSVDVLESAPPDANYSSLPPVDQGSAAWLHLAGATVIEALVWGLPFSIGVLHVYWVETLFPAEVYGSGTESVVVVAATLQTGLLYMAAGWFQP